MVFPLVFFPDLAHACSVCFGDPESLMFKGAQQGIFFLLCLVAAVLLAFSVFFIVLWRRAKAHTQHLTTEHLTKETTK